MGKLEKIQSLDQRKSCLGLVSKVSKLLRILSGTFMSVEEHLQPSKEGL